MQVTIIKSTAKAHLVENAAGQQAWIQARWLKADGSVSDDTFNKSASALAKSKAEAEAEKEFKNSYHPLGEISKESEKAVAIQAHWENFASEQSGSALVWIPKSQIKDGAVPGWLLQAKARELKERLTRQFTTFEIVIAGKFFTV
jgi:hypothetical protein